MPDFAMIEPGELPRPIRNIIVAENANVIPPWLLVPWDGVAKIGDLWDGQAFIRQPLVGDLVAAKAKRMKEIDDLRDLLIARGARVTVGEAPADITFLVQTRDDRDKVNVNGIVSLAILATVAQQPFQVGFRDADDIVHELDGSMAISMGQQVGLWVESHYVAAWDHKDAIKAIQPADGSAAALRAALLAIEDHDITTNWPAQPAP